MIPWWVYLIGAMLIVGGIYSALPDIAWRLRERRRRVEKRRRKAAKLRQRRRRRWDRRMAYWMSMLPEKPRPPARPLQRPEEQKQPR